MKLQTNKNIKFFNNLIKEFKRKVKYKNKVLPLHEPFFNKAEEKYVLDCVKSTFVSTRGQMVKKFEDRIKKITNSKYAVAIVNGTCALHLALKLLGTRQGDEVLLPSLTFAGTSHAVLNSGGIPHFLESEYDTLGIDPIKLEKYLKKTTSIKRGKCFNKKTGRKISAIIVVHVFGHPAKIDLLLKISKRFKIPILEDAAEGVGSIYKKKHVGTFGKIGVVSFNGNKTITTGGGGIIITKDKKISIQAKHLSLNSRVNHKWEYIHDKEGYNYGMPAINAALGLAQLEKLGKLINFKRKLYRKYYKKFKNINYFKLLKEPIDAKSNYWLQTIILEKKYKQLKKSLLLKTNSAGIMTRPVWRPMHKLEHLKKYPRMQLKVAEDIYDRAINIPSSPNLIKII